MTMLTKSLATAALMPALGMPPAIAQGTAIEAASTRGSTLYGTDRPGPWGDSAYDFALKVSTSIYKTVNLHRDLGARLAEANLAHYDKVAEILWDASDEGIDWEIEDTVRSSVTDWLRSTDGHREALMDADARIVGIGTAIRNERVVVTMLLGAR